MSRATRIQRIIALKRLDELLAARQLMSARQQLTKGQQVHTDLLNYNEHYDQRSQQAMVRKDAGALHRERQFSEQISSAITQQEEALVRHGQQVAQDNNLWLQKRTRSLATEALLKKVQATELQRQERISAREMDEIAQRTPRTKLR